MVRNVLLSLIVFLVPVGLLLFQEFFFRFVAAATEVAVINLILCRLILFSPQSLGILVNDFVLRCVVGHIFNLRRYVRALLRLVLLIQILVGCASIILIHRPNNFCV
jgi:hypothetical protein